MKYLVPTNHTVIPRMLKRDPRKQKCPKCKDFMGLYKEYLDVWHELSIQELVLQARFGKVDLVFQIIERRDKKVLRAYSCGHPNLG